MVDCQVLMGVTLKEIEKIDRFIEPPERGVMCDLLWADPVDGMGRKPSKRGVSMASATISRINS